MGKGADMKKKFVMTMLVMSCVAILPLQAAAEVNEAEERIERVVDGTYSYDGKKYQVTDEYKVKVHEYLDRADVNMTNDEVSEYIATFYNNLGQGIDGGYLTEVQKKKPEKTEDKKEDNAGSSDNQEADATPAPEATPIPEEDEDVVVIDPNMSYTVSNDDSVTVEEKPEGAGQQTIEELAEEYSVDIDKIKEMQDEIAKAQESVETQDISEQVEIEQAKVDEAMEDAEDEMEEPEEEEVVEVVEEATATPEVTEAPEEIKTEKKSNAGIIVGIIAAVAAIGAGVFVFIRKKKNS